MTSETSRSRSKRLTAVLKWSAIVLVFITLALLAVYAAIPLLVAHLGPQIAARAGVAKLELAIGYPTLKGIDVKTLVVAADQYAVRGENARVDYRLAELAEGRIDSLTFGLLDVTLVATPSPAAPRQRASLDQLVPATPFGRLAAERLLLRLPEIGFIGSGHAELGDGILSFTMAGIEPVPASRFSVTAELSPDGVFHARFGESEDGAIEFLNMSGAIEGDAMSIEGTVSLSGYALQMASAFARLPQGTGSVSGRVRTRLPWPPPETLSWSDLDAEFSSVSIDWISAQQDVELDSLAGSAQLRRGDIAAAVTGALRRRASGGDIVIQLPEAYRLSYSERVLSGGAGVRIRMSEAGNEATALLHSFSLSAETGVRVDLDANVAASVDTLQIDARLKAGLSLDVYEPPTGAGRIELGGMLQSPSQRRKGSVAAAFTLSGTELSADGRLTSGILEDIPFALDYRLDSAAGSASASKTFHFREPVAAALLPGWDESFDLDKGRVDASLKLRWQSLDTVAADLVLTLSNAEAHYEDYLASGISGQLHFVADDSSDIESWKLEPASVRIQRTDVGTAIDDLVMRIAWSGDRIDVSAAGATLLGGRASASPVAYHIPSGSASFTLALESIDLAKVLALEGDDIIGTGTLTGTLPVTIENDRVSVVGGHVAAQAPGGTIRLTPSFSGPTGQAGLDFALLALKNFTYTVLSADIDYSPDGDLNLAVHLQGRNPEIEKGRPIHYNVNISENVPVLLESLRLQERVTERLEKEVKKR